MLMFALWVDDIRGALKPPPNSSPLKQPSNLWKNTTQTNTTLSSISPHWTFNKQYKKNNNNHQKDKGTVPDINKQCSNKRKQRTTSWTHLNTGFWNDE
jgi:hypothetical protein